MIRNPQAIFLSIFGIGSKREYHSEHCFYNQSASANRTLQITDTERPILIALHVESERW